MNKGISRRTLLRGVGVAMALPWLESMGHLVSGISARGGECRGGCVSGCGAGA